jgi:hypothetical protein
MPDFAKTNVFVSIELFCKFLFICSMSSNFDLPKVIKKQKYIKC